MTASENVKPGIRFPIAIARVGELYLIPAIAQICSKQIPQYKVFFFLGDNMLFKIIVT